MHTFRLKEEDTEALSTLISAELAARITARAHADTFNQKLKIFAAHEGHKLARELGQSDGAVDIAAVSPVTPDGTEVAVTLSIHGREVPKPFFLVLEDGQYKVSATQHGASDVTIDTSSRSSSAYRVRNNDYVTRSFSCSPKEEWWQIGPYPAELKVGCHDSCSSWFFDGTRFYTEYGVADCDYNTWGVDMYIQNGYPVCNDAC